MADAVANVVRHVILRSSLLLSELGQISSVSARAYTLAFAPSLKCIRIVHFVNARPHYVFARAGLPRTWLARGCTTPYMKGVKPGVYDTWIDASKMVNGFSGNVHMKTTNRQAAYEYAGVIDPDAICVAKGETRKAKVDECWLLSERTKVVEVALLTGDIGLLLFCNTSWNMTKAFITDVAVKANIVIDDDITAFVLNTLR